jgi:hypothetical protein
VCPRVFLLIRSRSTKSFVLHQSFRSVLFVFPPFLLS